MGRGIQNCSIHSEQVSPHGLGEEDTRGGTRPDVSHIRIFGSVCYCHVHADNRKKLDPSGDKGLLVGYSEISKAYRVYIPAHRRIIVSRDVQFDEGRAL